ncbi:HTH-type transcriptional regulatory protein gabR [Fusicatenibacter saccharivorans]|nr:HTH-type transcriptional regulatory protein gabR [Fusicatenibacter saccharivorans]
MKPTSQAAVLFVRGDGKMNELTISLDPHRKTPLYEQIYGFIREEIRGGRIRAGERLPSARALSGYLSVSRSTVDLAYEQLVSEGYLESVPCKGYFVCEIEGLYRLDEKKEETKEDDAAEQTPFRYDFAVTGTAPGGFPQNSWKKISKEVLLDADDSLFQLGDAKGEHGLREAIRDYLHHARGVNCRTEQIIVGAGNDYLLMLLSVILGRGHKVAMENPTYISAYRCFAKLGYAMCTVSMDEAGMRPAELEKSGADLAYIMPSHQFPMGMVMPMKRRMQLLAWASRENGRYLIEDDYDSEFRYKGRPIPALQGNDTEGKVIYLGTFSRAIAPSIRISYMVLPETLLPAYEENGRCFSATVSKTDQKILEEFMRSGAFERHLNRMRAQYKGKHDLLIRLLKEFGREYTVSGENAGVHVLVHLPRGLSEAEAVQRAKEDGVRVYGLERYCIGAAADPAQGGTVLLGYAGLSEEEIAEAAAILKKCWNA